MNALESMKVSPKSISTGRRIRQAYLLILVDEDIDENNDDYRNTLAELRKVVREVKACRTPEQCIEYLTKMDEDKAFVISSAALGRQLAPKITEITKLNAIYIFGSNRAEVEE